MFQANFEQLVSCGRTDETRPLAAAQSQALAMLRSTELNAQLHHENVPENYNIANYKLFLTEIIVSATAGSRNSRCEPTSHAPAGDGGAATFISWEHVQSLHGIHKCPINNLVAQTAVNVLRRCGISHQTPTTMYNNRSAEHYGHTPLETDGIPYLSPGFAVNCRNNGRAI
ncbi:hypothetical protein J6590_031366 [Homalodisca vitripennis]|nr:hypothetical protein J6590_031366 [Homalodisca vitripennis]